MLSIAPCVSHSNFKALYFVHSTTGEALSIDFRFSPRWVLFLRNSSRYRRTAGASFQIGTIFHGSQLAGDAVYKALAERNEFFWTKIISEYTKRGQGSQALRIYKNMREQGVTPKSYTFVAVLKACSSIADLESGKQIHAHAIEQGDQSDIFVANTLVDMYAKCGCMVKAREVFETMTYRDPVSWNAMITGYAQSGEGKLALQLYSRMQREGFRPNARTFVAALKACGSLAMQEQGKEIGQKLLKLGCFHIGKTIHSQVAKCGLESQIFVASTLVDMYGKCGSMVHARSVFEKMPYRNAVSWTAMIMGYVQQQEGGLALQLYERMQREGFRPNGCTFVAALMACGILASLETGKEIHSDICRVGLESETVVVNCIIDMYSKCGSMVDAQRLFDASPVRDVVTWNALIAGYGSQGDCGYVFDLFERMQQEGIQPVSITFASVLTVCSHTGSVDKGQKYFQVMCSDYGITPVNEHYSCMVDLLGRAGQLDEAVALIKKMPFKPNLVTWMAILGACRNWNYVEIGRHVFACAVCLDQNQAAAYVLMTNIFASAYA